MKAINTQNNSQNTNKSNSIQTIELVDTLNANLCQARGTLAFILQHLETMGSFNSIEKAIYDTMWNVDDLLRESHNLVIFHTFKPNLTLSDDLTRYLAQASGMATVFINHHDDNGRWKISSELITGFLMNIDRLMDKTLSTINKLGEVVSNE